MINNHKAFQFYLYHSWKVEVICTLVMIHQITPTIYQSYPDHFMIMLNQKMIDTIKLQLISTVTKKIIYHIIVNCDNGMISDTSVRIISVYDTNVRNTKNCRTLSIIPINENVNYNYEQLDMITMDGTTQKEFKRY